MKSLAPAGYAWVIAVPKINPCAPQTFIGDPKDGGCRTWHADEVKTWKSSGWAVKWLAERGITGARIILAKVTKKGKIAELPVL